MYYILLQNGICQQQKKLQNSFITAQQVSNFKEIVKIENLNYRHSTNYFLFFLSAFSRRKKHKIIGIQQFSFLVFFLPFLALQALNKMAS